MKKTKLLLWSLLMFLSITKFNAQTCASPINLPDVDVQWPQLDSFATTERWFKFKADASQLRIDAYLKNYNSMVHSITIYEDNCSTLPVLTTTTTVAGDNLFVTTPTLTVGNYYLIKIENNSGLYLTYQLMKRYIASSAPLGCSTVTCSVTPNCEYVCNGGFECLNQTPNGLGGIFLGWADNWTSANIASPDLLSSLATPTSGNSLPCHVSGYTNAYLGNNCAGIIPTYTQAVLSGEYIETQLIAPLIAGKTYSISFWVKHGIYYPQKIEDLGIFLTSTQISNTTAVTISNYTPAAITTNTALLNDFNNWQNVILTYTAFGGEQYLTIGNTSNAAGNPTFLTAPATPPCFYSSFTITNQYLYIDEVSLREVITTPTMAFNLPSNICQSDIVSLNGLATPTGGVFSGVGVTNVANSYSFNAAQNLSPGTYTITYVLNTCSYTGTITSTITINPNPTISISATSTSLCPNQSATLTASGASTYTWVTIFSNTASIVVSPTISTTYTVVGINSFNCSSTQTIVVSPVPLQTLTLTTTSTLVCGNSNPTATLTAIGAVNYTWQPGNLTGSSVTVAPTSSTVYTVTGGNFTCTNTGTIAVKSLSFCCTSSVAVYSGTSISTSTNISTPFVFNEDLTVQNGNQLTLSTTEFLFAPNVRIIVKSGANLSIEGAHLYSCDNMWQGIVVEDGGSVWAFKGTNHNLVEDAIVAIDASNQFTTTITPFTNGIIDVKETTFNRNFVAISISEYTHGVMPFPFSIHSNVFTSRSLTFSPTSWPSTTTSVGGLREVNSPTTGLVPPHAISGFSITNLKAPHNTQSAHKGIQLSSVGSTTGTTTYRMIQIGRTVSTNEYNVFDALGQSIDATNTNLLSLNNVFQNSQQFIYDPPGPPPAFLFGGDGLKNVTTSLFNAQLNLTPSGVASPTLAYFGNRFYDCHYAVNADNIYVAGIRYATFRSTQSNTNTTTIAPGNTGISLKTNRAHYIIGDNNFANINTAINIPMNVASYSFTTSQFGIAVSAISIERNYIGATPITATTSPSTEYVRKAITITSPMAATFAVVPITGQVFTLLSNTLNNVYNGIEVSNMSKINFVAVTNSNVIGLRDTDPFSTAQNAIKYTGNRAGFIATNTLSAQSATNTQVALFFSTDSWNDTITCNTLSNSYRAFRFDGMACSNNQWTGNTMQNHGQGMVLTNGGIIGQQGNNTHPTDNQWLTPGPWTGTVNGTFVDAASDATMSPLWVRTTGNFYPPNPGFISQQASYANTVSATFTTSTGSYACTAPNQNPVNVFFYPSTVTTVEHNYNNVTSAYRYLDLHPRYKNYYQSYYDSLAGTTYDKFNRVEKGISIGRLAAAQSINSSITPTNNVEQTYKDFYDIHLKSINGTYNGTDSTALYSIANSCPADGGPAVYYARALYNYLYNVAGNYYSGCGGILRGSQQENVAKNGPAMTLEYKLYPNPANNFVTLVGGKESERLNIKVNDVSGKLLFEKDVITQGAKNTIDLDLKNGIYFVTITNASKETNIKKLVISK